MFNRLSDRLVLFPLTQETSSFSSQRDNSPIFCSEGVGLLFKARWPGIRAVGICSGFGKKLSVEAKIFADYTRK